MNATILVVAEPLTHQMISRALRPYGYDTHETSNGEKALMEISSVSPPDLVLCDIMMSGANGPLLAKRLREQNPGIPLIIVTDEPDENARQDLQEITPHILIKTFKVGELLEKVSEAFKHQLTTVK